MRIPLSKRTVDGSNGKGNIISVESIGNKGEGGHQRKVMKKQ